MSWPDSGTKERLRNLITTCGSRSGRWDERYTVGCAPIWATQFGCRAGLRRDREDIVAIGQATASAESSSMRSLVWDAAFGDVDPNHPAIYWMPALLVSGTLGESGKDGRATLFKARQGDLWSYVVRLAPTGEEAWSVVFDLKAPGP